MGDPVRLADPGTWVDDPDRRTAVSLSLQLLPFAGIAFLWFIGVLRDRIGSGEDRFFATVFLGSGLLFIAMFFASGAMAAGLVTTAAEASVGRLGNLWPFGRRSTASLASVYGLRMAAVFTMSATTLATRLQVVPRWLAVLGYATAVVLLFGVGLLPWLELVFPAWVFALSVHLLVVTFRRSDSVGPGVGRRHERAALVSPEVFIVSVTGEMSERSATSSTTSTSPSGTVSAGCVWCAPTRRCSTASCISSTPSVWS